MDCLSRVTSHVSIDSQRTEAGEYFWSLSITDGSAGTTDLETCILYIDATVLECSAKVAVACTTWDPFTIPHQINQF
jgi:hypothetical protein